MVDVIKQREELERRIVEGQKRLRAKDKNSPLLEMVEVNSLGIDYKENFCDKYLGMSVGEGFNKYANDLEKAASW